MAGVWLSLGANLGDPRAALEAAIEEIKAIPGVRAFRRSSFYQTSPENEIPLEEWVSLFADSLQN